MSVARLEVDQSTNTRTVPAATLDGYEAWVAALEEELREARGLNAVLFTQIERIDTQRLRAIEQFEESTRKLKAAHSQIRRLNDCVEAR